MSNSAISILADFLVAKYPTDLAAGNVKGLVEDAVNNYNYTEWKPYHDALHSNKCSPSFYVTSEQHLFSLLYALFITQFNINLLSYNFKFSSIRK